MVDAWHFACKGKARPGDSAGTSSLHVWRRLADKTAICVKCNVKLNLEEAKDCFNDRQ